MKTNFRVALSIFAGAFVLGGIAACSRPSDTRDIDWARAALARNPQFEIMATDEKARVFTVRDATDGSVRTLRIDELVAAPPAPKVAAAPASQPAETPPADPPADPAPGADLAAAAPPGQTTETVAVERAGGGEPLVEGPGYSISRSAGASRAPASIEGPGYSITREQPATRQAATRAETAATAVANVQRRNEPIRCQGNRLMRIDGETFEFSGDAVIAENGCDLYISNARIRANGVGIIARQARVHIVNSTIGGTRGSYEVSDGAEIYVARSTFAGVGRRFDTATMNDLGGNQYRLDH